MAQGPGEHRRAEAAVTDQLEKAGLAPAGALVDALHALDAPGRIGLVTPYLRPLAERVVGYLESEGFEVVDWAQMPSLDLIGPAEAEFGLPVLSAATAGAYALLRALDLPAVLPGAGSLLELVSRP